MLADSTSPSENGSCVFLAVFPAVCYRICATSLSEGLIQVRAAQHKKDLGSLKQNWTFVTCRAIV